MSFRNAKEPQRRYQHASQITSDVQSITSASGSALARTVAHDTQPQGDQETAGPNLAQQELAGKMLLPRRQLMEYVEESLARALPPNISHSTKSITLKSADEPARAIGARILSIRAAFVKLHDLTVGTPRRSKMTPSPRMARRAHG